MNESLSTIISRGYRGARSGLLALGLVTGATACVAGAEIDEQSSEVIDEGAAIESQEQAARAAPERGDELGASASAAGPELQFASAPSCITTWVDDGSLTDTAYARNDCGSQQRIKILWAFDTDGPCTTVSPGGTIWSRRAYPARFDGVDSC
ncbi:uncharacterized protein SOCEGT47_028910 [Sorangium cellulosum]|uniref:Uncharacterized protein n=1 Tax=Sorangium cellulosum TaxID=56 RepID=A0A4P2PZU8_SORCE|nr:hypothetical protein [Sorangium cellulosum]AUX22390.1 uncharacterized protein SOCEGT47_028910 [Sorangium cellulosum]